MTTETYDAALSRAAKLLRLAQSNNPHEAALATAHAQEIMERWKIDSFAVEAAQNGSAPPSEPIKDFGNDPLDTSWASWKSRLTNALCRAHGCKLYLRYGDPALIGRPGNVQTVRYFYGWLTREVDRLAKIHCRGNGRTYANNFRIGAAEVLAQRLTEQQQATVSAVKAEHAGNPLALALVQKALVKMQAEVGECQAWADTHLKLRKGRPSYGGQYNSNARQAGREAARSIPLGRATGALGGGSAMLRQ